MGVAQIHITEIAVLSHQWEEKTHGLRDGQLLCTKWSQGTALEKRTAWLTSELATFYQQESLVTCCEYFDQEWVGVTSTPWCQVDV